MKGGWKHDIIFDVDVLPLYGWETNPWVWVIEFERAGEVV